MKQSIDAFLLLIVMFAGCNGVTQDSAAEAKTTLRHKLIVAAIRLNRFPSHKLQRTLKMLNTTITSFGIVITPVAWALDSLHHTHTTTNFDNISKRRKMSSLKRLFVLQHLYSDMDIAIRNYADGRIRIGKYEYRQMTPVEKTAAKLEILKMLNDLETFDPNDPEREIARQRSKLD